MLLPFLDRVEIPPAKLRDYLLNPEHPVGGTKARFFASLGFHRARWLELHAALLAHAAGGDATALPAGSFGQRYIVRGSLEGANGARAGLRAVWIVTHPGAGPRFITAYPEDTP